jgi:hypothetical protein
MVFVYFCDLHVIYSYSIYGLYLYHHVFHGHAHC